MSGSEIGAIIVGLLLGYWIISAFLPKKTSQKSEPSEAVPGHKDPSGNPDQAPSNQPLKGEVRSPDWHEVLGVPAAASSEEIRAAYRSLIGKYHPDKVASLGTEIKLVAERKTMEIMAAYRIGMRNHGIEV